jgi:hypothetical protein
MCFEKRQNLLSNAWYGTDLSFSIGFFGGKSSANQKPSILNHLLPCFHHGYVGRAKICSIDTGKNLLVRVHIVQEDK